MIKFKISLFLLSILVFNCCNAKKAKDIDIVDANPINEIRNPIKVYDNISLVKDNLSYFADSIFCIPLETNSNCLIGGMITDVFMTDEYVFVIEPKAIKKFSRTGKYIRSIGTIGKGPGEFPEIGSISINCSKKELYIYPHFRKPVVITYNFDGKFIKETSIEGNYLKVYVHPEGFFVAQMESFGRFSPRYKKLTILDSLGHLTKSLDSGIFPISPKEKIYMYGNMVDPTFMYNGKMFFWEEYSDTVHVIGNEGLNAAYTIEPNKLKIPFNEYYYKKYNKEMGYRQIMDIDIFGNNLMLKLNDKGTPKLAFFNVKTGDLSITSGKMDSQGDFRNYPFIYTLQNDLIGGVFYPQFQISQGYSAMVLSYSDILQYHLIDKLRSINNNRMQFKYQCIDVFEKLNIQSNPVLIVVKTKD